MSYNQNHVIRLAEIIEDYSKIGHQVSLKYKDFKFPKEEIARKYLLLNFIKRAVYHSTSIQEILKYNTNINGYTSSIALLLRGCMLDFLFVMSLQVKLNSSIEAYDDWAFQIMGDHFQWDWEKMSSEHKAHYVNLLPPDFFIQDSGNTVPKYMKRISIAQITTIIKSSPEYHVCLAATTIYEYLSKFEHFGMFTLMFEYHEEDMKPYFFYNLVRGIVFIQDAIRKCMINLGFGNTDWLEEICNTSHKTIDIYNEIKLDEWETEEIHQ